MIQFARYAIVGGISTVADISVFALFANTFGINYIISNTLSFVAGLFTNYYLSRSWVFNSSGGGFRKDFLPFTVIGVVGLVISNLLLFVFIDLNLINTLISQFTNYNDLHTIRILAKSITVFIVLFWNFAARKKIVFNN